MTGSLQVKNGKFYMIINDRENGKRKQKWIATGLDVRGNKRRAEQLLRETLLEYERTPKRPKCDLLFSDYIRSWLKVAERRVDSVTFQGYQLMANAQVIPYLTRAESVCRMSPGRPSRTFLMKKPGVVAKTAKAACPLPPCGSTKISSTRL